MMHATESAYILIKEFESLELRAYRCASGQWTIGYGSATDVRPGMVITTSQAEARLKVDVREAERKLNSILKVPVKQNEYNALISIIFNARFDKFRTSTLIQKINNLEPNVSVEFLKWNKARIGNKIKPLRGLTRRRVTERRLFDTGVLRIEPL